MALPLFCHGFLDDLRLEPLFGRHFLELLVFRLKLLEPGNHGTVHATLLGTPFVKRGTVHVVLTAHLGHRRASLRLFQNRHNLAIAISGFTHRISFVENSTLKHYDFWEDYPCPAPKEQRDARVVIRPVYTFEDTALISLNNVHRQSPSVTIDVRSFFVNI